MRCQVIGNLINVTTIKTENYDGDSVKENESQSKLKYFIVKSIYNGISVFNS